MPGEPNPGAVIVFNRGMLSLEEISDRLEIQQLLIDYSTAIDQRRFDDLDTVFTPDAYIDYRASGRHRRPVTRGQGWLTEVLPNFPAYSHMLGNVDVRVSMIGRRHRDVAGDLLQPDGAGRCSRSGQPDASSSASGTSTSSSAPPRAGG